MGLPPHIDLPLGRLITRLRREGFQIGASAYVEVEAYLLEIGEDWKEVDWEEVKMDLALLLVKNEDEQEQFYRLFKYYYPQAVRLENESEEEGGDPKKDIWYFFFGVCLIAICVVGIWAKAVWDEKGKSVPIEVDEPQQAFVDPSSLRPSFAIPTCKRVWDSIHFHNLTQYGDSLVQDSVSFRWDFGDGSIETTDWNPIHQYNKAGLYKVRFQCWAGTDSMVHMDSIQIDGKLKGQIQMRPNEVQLGEKVNLSIALDAESEIDSLLVSGQIGKEAFNQSSLSYTFNDPKQHKIIARIQDKGDCSAITLEAYVDLQTGLAPLANPPLKKQPEKQVEIRTWELVWGYWGGGIMLTLLLAYIVSRFLDWWVNGIPKYIRDEVDERLQDKCEPPYWLQMPKKRQLIQSDGLLYALAGVLRKRIAGDQWRMDVRASLHATIQSGGIPNIQYVAVKKAVSYLVLIEQGNMDDQRSRLFQYWMEQLDEVGEVNMEVYTFREDIRFLSKVDEPSHKASLEELARDFPDSRIMVLGEGDSLLNGLRLHGWVSTAFEKWKYRMLFTPTPIHKWSYQELMLEEVFTVYPISPQGQQWLTNVRLGDMGVLRLKEYEKRWREEREGQEWPDRIEWDTYEGLQAYFNYIKRPELLQWLAATVVYPIPDLDVCLIVGKLLGDELSYANLYALMQVSWMQTGKLPPNLRSELIKSLPDKTEKIVRTCIRGILDKLRKKLEKTNSQSRALSMVAIQEYIQSGETGEISELHLRYLEQHNLLPSSLSFERNQQVNHWSFAISLLLGLICIFSIWGRFPHTKALADNVPPTWGYETVMKDSVVFFFNKGIDEVHAGEYERANSLFDEALRFNSRYEPALKYKELLSYLKGKAAYENGEIKEGLAYFKQGDIDGIFGNHRWHGIGLCHYYQNQLDSAHLYYQELQAYNPRFFVDWKRTPNLYTLLSMQEDVPELISLTDSLLNRARILSRNDSCEQAVKLYRMVLKEDSTNTIASLGIKGCGERKDTVLAEKIQDSIRIRSRDNTEDSSLSSIEDFPKPEIEKKEDLNALLSMVSVKNTSSSYMISKTEVTFKQYDAFCEATNRDKPGDKGWGRGLRPVINVSWYDAIEYCNWLSRKEGLDECYTITKSMNDSESEAPSVACDFSGNGYRLPTKAEWEYAAIGGSRSRGNVYAGTSVEDSIYLYANYCDKRCEWGSKDRKDDGYKYTAPIGRFYPNELGLYDMSGNVAEWCWNYWSNTDSKKEVRDSFRVVCGGSYFGSSTFLRVTHSFRCREASRKDNVGFRVARSISH